MLLLLSFSQLSFQQETVNKRRNLKITINNNLNINEEDTDVNIENNVTGTSFEKQSSPKDHKEQVSKKGSEEESSLHEIEDSSATGESSEGSHSQHEEKQSSDSSETDSSSTSPSYNSSKLILSREVINNANDIINTIKTSEKKESFYLSFDEELVVDEGVCDQVNYIIEALADYKKLTIEGLRLDKCILSSVSKLNSKTLTLVNLFHDKHSHTESHLKNEYDSSHPASQFMESLSVPLSHMDKLVLDGVFVANQGLMSLGLVYDQFSAPDRTDMVELVIKGGSSSNFNITGIAELVKALSSELSTVYLDASELSNVSVEEFLDILDERDFLEFKLDLGEEVFRLKASTSVSSYFDKFIKKGGHINGIN